MNSKHQKKEINTTKDIITSLVKTINEKPDKLHADYTVSVHELIK